MKPLLAIIAASLLLCGCAGTLNAPKTQPLVINGQQFTVASATATAPVGNNFTGMWLFDAQSKLIWSGSSPNSGLLQSGFPQTMLNGLSDAASAVTAVYGIK